MDGCNDTEFEEIPCVYGGALHEWRSPALRGPDANWTHAGKVFQSNATVLPGGFVHKEFVTIDFIGFPDVDPSLRIFFDNVGGNGGGDGCCDGTTSWRIVKASDDSETLEELEIGMVDYGAFFLDADRARRPSGNRTRRPPALRAPSRGRRPHFDAAEISRNGPRLSRTVQRRNQPKRSSSQSGRRRCCGARARGASRWRGRSGPKPWTRCLNPVAAS